MANYADVIPALHSDMVELNQNIARLAQGKDYTLYGFHIDSTESDPASAVTYLEDAVGMTPAKMDFTNGAFDYGSWKNAFFMPRPVMLKSTGAVDYYLDENDYAKKEDGTASDVADTSYDGNAMMEWGRNGKKIWLKVEPDSDDPTSVSIYICDKQLDSTYHAWSFFNKDNRLVDHFYTPIYNGSLIDSKIRSISGQALSYSQTGANEVTYATANGDGWYTEVVSDRVLITYLLWLMGKSLDLQGTYGQGMSSGGETAMKAYKTGALNDKGLFFGYSATTNAVKVFGMENFWGCQWRRTAGLVQVSGAVKYKLTRGTADGSTATDYNSAGDGYLEAGVTMADGGWAKSYDYSTGIYLTTANGGSTSTYYCDYYWINKSATCYALYGGRSVDGSICGSSLLLSNTFTYASWNVGAALSFKPAA